MMSLEEFKKTLPNPEKYTEAEIKKMRDILDKFADIVFDRWLRDRNIKKEGKKENAI